MKVKRSDYCHSGLHAKLNPTRTPRLDVQAVAMRQSTAYWILPNGEFSRTFEECSPNPTLADKWGLEGQAGSLLTRLRQRTAACQHEKLGQVHLLQRGGIARIRPQAVPLRPYRQMNQTWVVAFQRASQMPEGRVHVACFAVEDGQL